MEKSRILIVDDDPLTRYSLKELLRLEGYPVETAEDGAVALQMLGENRFDVVIFPGGSGKKRIAAGNFRCVPRQYREN